MNTQIFLYFVAAFMIYLIGVSISMFTMKSENPTEFKKHQVIGSIMLVSSLAVLIVMVANIMASHGYVRSSFVDYFAMSCA